MEYSAPGIRSSLEDLRSSLEDADSEVRGLLSKHASTVEAAKDGQRLLKGFYTYSIASEVSSLGPNAPEDRPLTVDACTGRCSRLLGLSAPYGSEGAQADVWMRKALLCSSP